MYGIHYVESAPKQNPKAMRFVAALQELHLLPVVDAPINALNLKKKKN